MTGKFISQAPSYEVIAKENFPLYGQDTGVITKQDNAYFKLQIGNLVILSMSFITNADIPIYSALMGFNEYTGTPTSNVFGMFAHTSGACASVYLNYSDVLVSAPLIGGQWRGFMMYSV